MIVAPPYFSSRDDGCEKSTVENTARDTAVRYTTVVFFPRGKKKKKETGKRITPKTDAHTDKTQILRERAEKEYERNEKKGKDEITECS